MQVKQEDIPKLVPAPPGKQPSQNSIEVRPIDGLWKPGLHSVHVVLPVKLLYVPTGHNSQPRSYEGFASPVPNVPAITNSSRPAAASTRVAHLLDNHGKLSYPLLLEQSCTFPQDTSNMRLSSSVTLRCQQQLRSHTTLPGTSHKHQPGGPRFRCLQYFQRCQKGKGGRCLRLCWPGSRRRCGCF